jgi:hypothetical protein
VSSVAAASLVVLGVLHVLYGLIRFRAPLAEAIAEGFVGRFMVSDTRRLAFWFILVGPLLSLIGWLALGVVRTGDVGALRTIGGALFAASTIGVVAFPKSPLWVVLPISMVFVAASLRWVS